MHADYERLQHDPPPLLASIPPVPSRYHRRRFNGNRFAFNPFLVSRPMYNTMYLLIEPRNEPEIIRPLTDNEPLDCDRYAADYANSLGADIAAPDGYIPDDCGDFRITLLPDLDNRTHVWKATEYFLELSE